MHEYSIIQALMGRVEAEARAHGASSVVRLEVRIGELSGVEPELLSSAYSMWRVGTICAAARLEIQRVPAAWSCPECQEPIPKGETLRCARCEVPARLRQGDEIFLDRIEMEVP
jgi:hydrogenase nickel incorporation protein HypA/HybF